MVEHVDVSRQPVHIADDGENTFSFPFRPRLGGLFCSFAEDLIQLPLLFAHLYVFFLFLGGWNMNFSIDVLDGFHVDVLVEKVAQAVKVLETDQPFNVFNFSGDGQLGDGFRLAEHAHEVVNGMNAEPLELLNWGHQRQHVEDFKRRVGDRGGREPVYAASVVLLADIVGLDCHIYGLVCCPGSRQIGNALASLAGLERVFVEMAFVRNDGVEAHVFEEGEFLCLFPSCGAVLGLDVGDLLVFLI